MGIGGVSIGSLLIILLVVLLIFGTKKIRGMGEDLGAGLKSFRKGMKESTDTDDPKQPDITDKSS